MAFVVHMEDAIVLQLASLKEIGHTEYQENVRKQLKLHLWQPHIKSPHMYTRVGRCQPWVPW